VRILVICGAGYVSGLEKITLLVIRGLQERGHDVHCVSTIWGDGDFWQRLVEAGIPRRKMPFGFISKTLRWSPMWMTLDQLIRVPQLWFQYLRCVREFQPDIVLHSNFHHAFLVSPFLNPKRTFLHLHASFAITAFYRRIIGFLSRRLTSIIPVSQSVGRSILALGIPASKVRVVLNGVETKVTRKSSTDDTRHPFTIGIVGQIGEWKGHTDLVDALAILARDKVNYTCLIYGRGEESYITQLKQRISELGLSGSVRFMDFEKILQNIFENLDVCVVPSRHDDPFPTTAIEAALFGVPVIASRKGGLPEIVVDGKTGVLVDAGSPSQIAQAILKLHMNQALRKSIGRDARSHAQKNFCYSRMAKELESIFLTAESHRSDKG